MTFLELANELKGSIPSLNISLAKTLINRALGDIYKKRLWSFLRGETTLLVPAQILTGTVSVTFGSQTVTADADAAAAWAAVTNPTMIQRQFRIGFSSPIYNIYAYDSDAGTITLDRPYAEPTNAASAYVVYRCYYAAPVADFKRWETMKDMVNSQPIVLNKTRQEVERRDPQRSSTTDAPFWCVAFQSDNNADSPSYRWPMYELFPHPTAQKGLSATFHRSGALLSADTDTIPYPLTDELLLVKARWCAYEWAEANKGAIDALRGPNWLQLMMFADKQYQTLFSEVRRNDEEIAITDATFGNTTEGPAVTMGADYLFNHDPR